MLKSKPYRIAIHLYKAFVGGRRPDFLLSDLYQFRTRRRRQLVSGYRALFQDLFRRSNLTYLNELQMDPSLRAVIKKYERFFNNKERFRKFQSFAIESYSEETVELAIMSVLCNVKTPDFEALLKEVLMDTLDDDENNLLSQLERFFDLNVFWQYVANHYGYKRETNTLKTLFIHLTVTALSHSVSDEYLTGVKDFIAERNKANALVFIDHWMHHKTDDVVFDQYAEMVEQEINCQVFYKISP